MPKRKLVPASQHAELTQYASLIRSLKTNNLLDVTTHLSQHAWKGKERAWKVDKDLEEEDDEILSTDMDMDMETLVGSSQNVHEFGPSTSSPPSLRQVTPSSTRKRKRTASPDRTASHGSISSTRAQSRIRDGWTRWPLLLKDVNVPEWGLEDEIEHLLASLGRHIDEGNEEENCTNLDPPPYRDSLTLTTTHLLHSVLAILAHFTPPRAPSLQNRIEPISWENVVHAFALAGGTKQYVYHLYMSSTFISLFRAIENVQRRIQAVYGTSASVDEQLSSDVDDARPSPSPQNQTQLNQRSSREFFPSTSARRRLNVATAAQTRLSESLSRYGASEDSLFTVPILKPSEQDEKRTTRKKKREATTDAPISSRRIDQARGVQMKHSESDA